MDETGRCVGGADKETSEDMTTEACRSGEGAAGATLHDEPGRRLAARHGFRVGIACNGFGPSGGLTIHVARTMLHEPCCTKHSLRKLSLAGAVSAEHRNTKIPPLT
jgi:hypothetical protein